MVGFYSGDIAESASVGAHAADLVPSSWGEQAAAGVGQALHDNWAARAFRGLLQQNETGFATDEQGNPIDLPPSPTLDAKTATERYGIPGALKFDQPIQEPVAAEQSDAKRAQLQRQDVLARGQSGLIGRAGLSGVDMLAGFLDPLNFASMFVPGLPEAKLAAAFGESVFGRIAARAVAGASQGIAGQAALLPADYLYARYADDDFTMGNALGQLAFGGLMGGALHSAIGGLTDVIGRRYARSEASAAIAGDPDLGEAVTRTAVAQMAEGRPIEIEPLIDTAMAERQALGEAYDQVRATSAGPANDPLVRITPEDIEGAIIERGGWNGQGDVTVKGTGYGLSKIIFKHGEGSNTDPSLQVTRDDLLAFPKVIREFEPTISGGATSSRDWRVSLPGPDGSPRTVVFADAAFTATDGQRRVITAYVQEPGRPGASRPLSQARTGAPGSSSELFRPLGDTAAGLTHRTPQGRETPAGEDIPTAEPGINTPPGADAAAPATSGLDAGAPGSSSELVRPLGDTAAGLTPRTPQGRETPASEDIATAEPGINTPASAGAPGSSSELVRPLGDTTARVTHPTPQGLETPAGEDVATGAPSSTPEPPAATDSATGTGANQPTPGAADRLDAAVHAAAGAPDEIEARAVRIADEAAAHPPPPSLDVSRFDRMPELENWVQRTRDAGAFTAEDEALIAQIEQEAQQALARQAAWRQAGICIARGLGEAGS